MTIFIDAGIENITIKNNKEIKVIKNTDKIEKLIPSNYKNKNLFITGKLADIVQLKFGGKSILSYAALLYKAQMLAKKTKKTIGIIDLSASGYLVLAVNQQGEIINDLLTINPKCGAGSGINIRRILEKLDIKTDEVDTVLKKFLGTDGKNKREAVTIRADRCGVFSSSATISDKNQGIPLEHALAVTLKSEVLKACKRMAQVDTVFLTGRVFKWKYMQDCAKDYLKSIGVKKTQFKEILLLESLEELVKTIKPDSFKQFSKIRKEHELIELPPFKELKNMH